MKSITKRLLILLFLSQLTPITCLSKTIFDSTEVKTIALIFADHQRLNVENSLLKQQIYSLEKLNDLYIESDSIQREELELYKDELISNEKTINKLKSSKKRTIIGSSIGGIILFIIGLIL